MSHKELPQNWLSPFCHGYFRNSKWPFKVLSISSFCGMGLSVIRSGSRKVLSIFPISLFPHLPLPPEPTTIELSNPSIPTKQLLSRSSTTPPHQIAKSQFTSPIVFLSSLQPLKEKLPSLSFHNSTFLSVCSFTFYLL